MSLRPHRPEDVDDIFEFAADPEWGRYLSVPAPYLREHAVAFVAKRILASRDLDPAWAMVLDGKVAGGIGLRIDAGHSRGELGWSLAKTQWGRGLVVEAARAVIDWGFWSRGLARVYALADVRNMQSVRVMEKLGMTREGVRRRPDVPVASSSLRRSLVFLTISVHFLGEPRYHGPRLQCLTGCFPSF